MHQFVVATAGAPFYPAPVYSGDNAPFTPVDVFYEINNYGYVLVEVEDTTVTITWKHRTSSGVYEAGGDVFTYKVNPTLIKLVSFTATPKVNKTILQWSTETEIDNAGFNIYRAESENGKYFKINDALIPAQGSSTQGSSYDFIDKEVKNRKTYYYKLEDIDLNGTSTMHGPVSATPRWIFGILKK